VKILLVIAIAIAIVYLTRLRRDEEETRL